MEMDKNKNVAQMEIEQNKNAAKIEVAKIKASSDNFKTNVKLGFKLKDEMVSKCSGYGGKYSQACIDALDRYKKWENNYFKLLKNSIFYDENNSSSKNEEDDIENKKK
jgi:hypothetical protein